MSTPPELSLWRIRILIKQISSAAFSYTPKKEQLEAVSSYYKDGNDTILIAPTGFGEILHLPNSTISVWQKVWNAWYTFIYTKMHLALQSNQATKTWYCHCTRTRWCWYVQSVMPISRDIYYQFYSQNNHLSSKQGTWSVSLKLSGHCSVYSNQTNPFLLLDQTRETGMDQTHYIF